MMQKHLELKHEICPVSVWLSALVVTIFSGYSAWQNPELWFQCFGIVCIVASFVRVLFFLIEGR